MRYRHTELNVATTVILALSIILAAAMLSSTLEPTSSNSTPSPATLGCVTVYLVAVLGVWLAAYRLTVEVDTFAVRWRVGVGFLKDSHALAQISDVRLVAAPFSLLPRIRRMGATRFISVAPGRRAVELVLADGRRMVLGTNDAQRLREAIVAAQRARTGRQ